MKVRFFEDNMVIYPDVIGEDLICSSPYWEEMTYVPPIQDGEQIGKFVDKRGKEMNLYIVTKYTILCKGEHVFFDTGRKTIPVSEFTKPIVIDIRKEKPEFLGVAWPPDDHLPCLHLDIPDWLQPNDEKEACKIKIGDVVFRFPIASLKIKACSFEKYIKRLHKVESETISASLSVAYYKAFDIEIPLKKLVVDDPLISVAKILQKGEGDLYLSPSGAKRFCLETEEKKYYLPAEWISVDLLKRYGIDAKKIAENISLSSLVEWECDSNVHLIRYLLPREKDIRDIIIKRLQKHIKSWWDTQHIEEEKEEVYEKHHVEMGYGDGFVAVLRRIDQRTFKYAWVIITYGDCGGYCTYNQGRHHFGTEYSFTDKDFVTVKFDCDIDFLVSILKGQHPKALYSDTHISIVPKIERVKEAINEYEDFLKELNQF